MEMIKKIGSANQKNFVSRTSFEKYFEKSYQSVIVLANPKTVINVKYATQAIKDQIIRSDQLIAHIKKRIRENKDLAWSEKEMYQIADFFMSMHVENTLDYAKKYFKEDSAEQAEDVAPVEIAIEETPLYQELKRYRYETSKTEGVKPYHIYSNAQLDALISAMPQNMDDIKKISGFGEVKCQKYGEVILEIVDKHRGTGV